MVERAIAFTFDAVKCGLLVSEQAHYAKNIDLISSPVKSYRSAIALISDCLNSALPLIFHDNVDLVMPSIREIAEMGYQFTQPFEVDASAGERRLGLRATPWAEAATETVAWWRERTLKVART